MKQETKEFLYSLGNFGIRPGLDNITEVLNRLDHPEHLPGIIHVAGTNGKGSTIMYLEQLLLDKGKNVGVTTSPHLVKLNERFRFNAQEIKDSELEYYVDMLFNICGINHGNQSNPNEWNIRLTFFEYMIVIAFLWFRDKGTEYILLETGMGGRLDATNIVKSMVQVITPISFDHSEYLGDTVEKIAREKAGILKPDTHSVIAPQIQLVTSLLKQRCDEIYNTTKLYGIDFTSNSLKNVFENFINSKFETDKIHPSNNTLVYAGEHQLTNATVASETFKIICDFESWEINLADQVQSILKVSYRGRCDIVSVDPMIVCDGAHNVAGMESLIIFLKQNFHDKKILMAMNFMRDKELIPALRNTENLDITFIPVEIDFDRALKGIECESLLKKSGFNTIAPLNISSLIRWLFNSEYKYEVAVIAGSLYLLGEFYDAFSRKEEILNNKTLPFDAIEYMRV